MPALVQPKSLQPARKLVAIRRIADLKRIKGTSAELATVDGWNVVVRKNAYVIGELIVFFEIDSFLPSTNGRFWEYCSSSSRLSELDGAQGYVVTTSLRHNHISQGLIFPLTEFSEMVEVKERLEQEYGGSWHDDAIEKLMDMDFAGTLGVKKFEVPFQVTSEEAESVRPPIFFPQPGAERAQNVLNLLEQHGDEMFFITEKLDGVPMTIYRVEDGSQWMEALPHMGNGSKLTRVGNGVVGVCGRHDDYEESRDSIFWTAARDQNIINKISKIGRNVAIQGELCGSSILGNSMGFKEGVHHFWTFGIYDIDKQQWMLTYKVYNLCKSLKIDHAPVVSVTELSHFAKNVGELLEKAEGKGVLGKNREGLIFATLDNTWSFKAISNSWLLQYGQHKIDQW